MHVRCGLLRPNQKNDSEFTKHAKGSESAHWKILNATITKEFSPRQSNHLKWLRYAEGWRPDDWTGGIKR